VGDSDAARVSGDLHEDSVLDLPHHLRLILDERVGVVWARAVSDGGTDTEEGKECDGFHFYIIK
jgi:hypothetical protein